jgi:dTMP kinase
LGRQGLFVTLEGGEGSGKTTLSNALAIELANTGHKVVQTREPGGTPGANEIRSLLVSGEAGRWSARTELMLALASRSDHVERVIEPALAAGAIVICDRFTDSSRVYQGVAGALGIELVNSISARLNILEPDVTLLLDIDPRAGLARVESRNGAETRFEAKGIDFHQSVRDGFRRLGAESPERIRTIDASASLEQVLTNAMAAIAPFVADGAVHV